MFARATGIAARTLGAVAILLAINTAIAEGLPEGVTVNVIAEYPSQVPTLETVRLIKVTMQPGSKFDNVLIEHEEYCRLEQGQLTRIIHDFGTTNVLSAGAFWAPEKGHRHTVVSTGEVAAIMWVYQMIEKGEGGKM